MTYFFFGNSVCLILQCTLQCYIVNPSLVIRYLLLIQTLLMTRLIQTSSYSQVPLLSLWHRKSELMKRTQQEVTMLFFSLFWWFLSGGGEGSLDRLLPAVNTTLSPRKRTTSQCKSEPPLLRTSKRTIYTAGRPPWYNEHGAQSKEAFVIGEQSTVTT